MQKDFMCDTWEDVKRCAGGKKIFLFGAGSMGQAAWKMMDRYATSWEVVGFIDNSAAKQGQKMQGLTVFPPEILKKYHADDVMVIICCMATAEISKQIYMLGIGNYYSLYHLDFPQELRCTCYQENIDSGDLEWLLNRVEDGHSREVVNGIVEKRKTGFFDYTDLKESGSEYFIDDFFDRAEDEVFIDGGGYDGDTIEEFIEWTNNKYKKIYSFEPQRDKAAIIRNKLWRYGDKVEFFERGLYSSETELSFCDGSEVLSGMIVEQGGDSKIRTIDIDSAVKDERVTFIKMDIEGAELEALKGAAETIRKNKPKLAICIYHKVDDMWQIPRYIDSLVPEYKFRIKHFGMRYAGTILYCSMK